MESYYSSDEEIAWGPRTLREIKSDLKRPRRKPKKRHSMPDNFQMDSHTVCRNVSVLPPEDTTDLCQEVADKFYVSQASTEYFTPNESLRANSKCDFLEKLSKVINEPPSQLSSYVSACDTTKTSPVTNESYVSIPNSDNSSYFTATGSNIRSMNDTYLNFVKKATERETQYDIANFQHTLVGSPVMSEGELAVGINEEQLSDDQESLCEENASHNVLRTETTDENVIVLSDDEESTSDVCLENGIDDDKLSQDGNSHVQGLEASRNTMYSRKDSGGKNYHNVKKTSLHNENVSDYHDDISENEQLDETEGRHTIGGSMPQILINDLLEKEATDEKVQSDVEISRISTSSIEDSFDENNLHVRKYVHNEGTPYCCDRLSEEERVNEVEEIHTVGITVSRPLSTIPEKESLNTSLISLPEIDLAQFDDSISKNESLQLNDTIEEMNRLLNEGLNYTVSDDESVIIDSTPLKEEPRLEMQFTTSNIISGSFSQKQTPTHTSASKLKVTKTPSGVNHATSERKQIPRYIKKTPDSQFKIPEKPMRQKLINPTPPKSCPSRLKNVMSPVALYIKNSPSVPLKQNVPHRELTNITPSKIPKAPNKENFPDLPQVVYKPSRKQISSQEKEIVLPHSIKRLNVKEPSITKHEGRIHQRSYKAKLSKRLLEDDITNNSIDCSMLDTSKDISVLTKKQAFIK